MRCPRCDREVPRSADACPSCGFKVAVRSLASEEATERLPRFGGDALIVGALGVRFESFASDRTDAFFPSQGSTAERSDSAPAAVSRVYVDAGLKAMLKPEAVLARAGGVAADDPRLTPVERRVFEQIDGAQPIAFVLTRSGVTTDELCMAIALLVDKGAIRQAGAQETGAVADTDRNPVWTGAAPEAPEGHDLSLLHELVVRKLRATGLPVPGEAAGGADPFAAPDTLPGERTIPSAGSGTLPGAMYEELSALWHEAAAAEDLGDHARAAQALREATVLHPSDPSTFNRYGVLLATRLADYEGARAALERALALDPHNAVYKNNLRRVTAARRRRD